MKMVVNTDINSRSAFNVTSSHIRRLTSIFLLTILLALTCDDNKYQALAGRPVTLLTPHMNLANVTRDTMIHLEFIYSLAGQGPTWPGSLNLIHNNDSFDEYIRTGSVAYYRVPGLDSNGAHYYSDDNDKLVSGGSGQSVEIINGVSRVRKNDRLCATKLEQIIERLQASVHLTQTNNLHLFNALDSWGKPEAGVLKGNRMWLGDYAQCKTALYTLSSSNDNVNNNKDIERTRYCLASLTWNKWLNTDGLPDEQYGDIEMAMCLPKVCDSIGAEANRDKLATIFHHLMGEAYSHDMNISAVYCLPDEQSPLTDWSRNPLAVTLAIFISIWLFIVTVCTLTDVARPIEMPLPRLVRCFSLKRALISLRIKNRRAIPTTTGAMMANAASGIQALEQKADMHVLDGLKAVALLAIVGTHTWLLRSSAMSGADSAVFANTFTGRMLTAAFPALSVNIFFVTTGMVMSYKLFKMRRDSITSAPLWAIISLHRYLRIVPIWLLAFWAMKCFKYFGSGPLWDYGTSNSSNVRHCEQESWTSVWLTGASLRSPQDHCFITGWYLADDIQFAIIVAPIYCILLHKMPRLAYSLMPVTIMFSFSYALYRLWGIDFDLMPVIKFDVQATSLISLEAGFLYSSPIVRAPYFMIGLAIGYIMYVNETTMGLVGKLATPAERWAFNFMRFFDASGSVLGSIVFIIIGLFGIELLRFVHFSIEPLRSETGFKYVLFPTMYLCSMVFVLMLPPLVLHRMRVSSVLALPLWTSLSRIALSIIVVHPGIVQYYYSSLTQSLHASNMVMLQTTVFLIVVSYFSGFLFYLIFEYPIKGIVDTFVALLIGGDKASKTSEAKDTAPITQNHPHVDRRHQLIDLASRNASIDSGNAMPTSIVCNK